jgi:hypothetical protein
MLNLKRASAVAAAAVSLAVAGTAPAHAQDLEFSVAACGGSVTVPGCVNWTFDETQRSIERARYTYNNQVQPVLDGGACAAYEILTGDPCPTKGMVPKI